MKKHYVNRKLFYRYIHDHRKHLLFFGIVVVVFAVVFFLYELPVEATGYAALLSGSIMIVLSIWDFNVYCKKCHTLLRLKEEIGFHIELLPETNRSIEKDYQELIRILHAEKAHSTEEFEKTFAEMADYYMLWAHQIKTPIAAMRLLIQSDLSDKEMLSSELFKIEQYVEMVLYYIRLESRSSDYVLKECHLDGIIRQAIRKYSRQFIYKGISLHYKGVDELVLTDEKWLLFVLEQLISNAVKYTNEGYVTIYWQPEGRLVIRDTGIGIPASDVPRIFEKGYTGYNGRTDRKSTGLGLYLCRRIMGKLSHIIEIESRVDQGTKVYIRFPDVEWVPE